MLGSVQQLAPPFEPPPPKLPPPNSSASPTHRLPCPPLCSAFPQPQPDGCAACGPGPGAPVVPPAAGRPSASFPATAPPSPVAMPSPPPSMALPATMPSPATFPSPAAMPFPAATPDGGMPAEPCDTAGEAALPGAIDTAPAAPTTAASAGATAAASSGAGGCPDIQVGAGADVVRVGGQRGGEAWDVGTRLQIALTISRPLAPLPPPSGHAGRPQRRARAPRPRAPGLERLAGQLRVRRERHVPHAAQQRALR